MNRMEPKEYWIERIYAIERNIGEVNSTVLFLGLILLQEALGLIQAYKNQTLRALWEEKHGRKAPDVVDELLEDEGTAKAQIRLKVEEVALVASPTFLKKQPRKPYQRPI